MALRKIISGGQTGADQGGLRAARALGLETGGWVPRGWFTHDGASPWLRDFGLAEAPSAYYPERTALNVRDADATIRFAVDFLSAGELCTLRAILKFEKLSLDYAIAIEGHRFYQGERFRFATHSHQIREFLNQHRVEVLNVAGNSERRAPGIAAAVERVLVLACRLGVV